MKHSISPPDSDSSDCELESLYPSSSNCHQASSGQASSSSLQRTFSAQLLSAPSLDLVCEIFPNVPNDQIQELATKHDNNINKIIDSLTMGSNPQKQLSS